MYTLVSVCFMCFSKDNLKSVFHDAKDNIVAKQVAFVLSDIPNMKVTSALHLHICSTCCSSLASAYAVKKRCLEKYNLFNTYINILQAPTVTLDHPLIKTENQQNAEIKNEVLSEHFEESEVEDNADIADGEIDSESQTSDVQDSAKIQNNEQGIGFQCTIDIKNEVGEIKQELLDNEFVTSGDEEQGIASGLKYKCTICSKTFVYSSLLIDHLKEHAENTFNAALKEEVMITDEEIEDNMSVNSEESEVDENVDGGIDSESQTNEVQDGAEQGTGSQCINDVQNEVDEEINQQLLNSDDVQDGGGEEQETDSDLKYKCTICSKRFRKRCGLDYHLKQHSEIKDLQCYICKNQCKTKYTYTVHMNTHLKGQDYDCSVCQKKFREKIYLQRHMKLHLKKQFKCTICNKMFSTKVELKFHLKVHAGIKNFKCKICGKKFIRKYQMQVHAEVHSNECNICNETFDTREARQKHMKIHFQCLFCGKHYTTQWYLRHHLKKHTGEKKCMMCEEQFHTQQALDTHLKKHYGITDYVCEFCKKGFHRKVYLKNHIQRKHPERL